MGNKRRRHQAHLRAAAETGARTAPAPGQWPALTGLRGVAALGVLLLHAFLLAGGPASVPAPLAWLFAMGWSGVDIFFTLSAFLLTIPFLRKDAAAPSAGEYARHRLLRILPAYYAQLAVLLLLGALGAGAMGWDAPRLADVLGNLAFAYGAVPGMEPHVPPWWTLPVELGFYLVLPLFARLLRPGRWPWLLAWIAASLAWRFWIMHAGLQRAQELAWVEHLPGRLHEFLVGMLAAYALVRLGEAKRLLSARARDLVAAAAILAFIALPALGFLVAGTVYNGAPTTNPLLLCWHLFASVVVAILLVALAAGAPYVGRLLSAFPLRGLGAISYSLYLWHYPILLGLREGLGGFAAVRQDFGPFVFYGLLFSIAAAVASWWMVERTAQRWGRQARLSS